MILSENYLRVPGKMYKVKVTCVSTRRLTTIEWLILTCLHKFSGSDNMSERTLKYAFEDIFQFQNSELIIKPCLKELKGLKVLNYDSDDNIDYDSLRFCDLEITDLGRSMLQEGLLPGGEREIPFDVYYNPLTGKMNHYDVSANRAKETIDFGTESDYEVDFPKDNIIEALQKGAVGGGRFIASKFRIESIEMLSDYSWDNIINMSADVDENGIITTNPPIIADGVKYRIAELFVPKELPSSLLNVLPVLDPSTVLNMIGSGKRIKKQIIDVCKNGRILIMDSKVYAVYKKNTSVFKGKVLILFDVEGEFQIENEKNLIINIPYPYEVPGCVTVNEKNGHVCLAKTSYIYEDRNITVPVVYEVPLLSRKNDVSVQWLKETVLEHYSENIQLISLFSLPMLGTERDTCMEIINKRWKDNDLEVIISDITKIAIACKKMKTEMITLDPFMDTIMEKIDLSENEKALDSISKLITSDCIPKKSDMYRLFVERIIHGIKPPTKYAELRILLQTLGISSNDDALQFDELIGRYYSQEIMQDILVSIVTGDFPERTELFEYDSFFNSYKSCLENLETYISDFKLFEKNDEKVIRDSIIACPDIAAVQSFLAELTAKNAHLMQNKINLYDLLKKKLPEQAKAYVENLKILEKYVNNVVEEVFQGSTNFSDAVTDENVPVKEKRKVYILDTCALIHHPDLFMYFKDDEYIRIPTKVIDELGKIKDKRNKKYPAETADTARTLARDIERIYIPMFNKGNKVRLLIENSSPELLPNDLDPMVPDNQILSVALKYKNDETYIISDDGVFRLASMAQDVVGLTGDMFISLHADSYVSLASRIKIHNNTEVIERNQKVSEPDKESNKSEGTTMNLIDNVLSAIEKSFDDTEKDKAPSSVELSIDDLPVKELKKYNKDVNDQVIAYLLANKIKTIRDFRLLTEERINSLPARKKQMILRNAVLRVYKQLDTILPKIKL